MPTDHEAGLSDDLKRAADEANLRFSQGMNPLLSQQFFADGFPDTLCHYTDFGGLHGILQTGTISATYTQTLNDGSEQEYGLKMVQDYIERFPNSSAMHTFRASMALAQQRNFACCFCFVKPVGRSSSVNQAMNSSSPRLYTRRVIGNAIEYQRLQSAPF
jgi:hypothetical protein